MNHLVSFNDTESLVNLAGKIKLGVLQNYSVCSKELSPEKFLTYGLNSFFTPETELMPLLGYVVYKEKIKICQFSFYEYPCKLQGDSIVEIDPILEGDNLGQMVQLLCKGTIVYNAIYKSSLKNHFYGCTLSLLPLKELYPTALMSHQSFLNYFKGVDHVLVELSKYYPVPMNLNEKQKEIFGFDKIDVYTGSQPDYISGFFGFLNRFSKGQVDFVYSYEGEYSDIHCGFDKVIKKETA